MTILLAFLTAAVVTWVLRSSMTLASSVRSTSLESVIALVAPAVLGAMVVSGLLVEHGQVSLPRLGEIAAVGSAIVVVRRTGNVASGLAAGLPAYWVASAIGAG